MVVNKVIGLNQSVGVKSTSVKFNIELISVPPQRSREGSYK
jgi:hypothetical protein